ncbi:MAG: molybdopterin molybdotransferase MoeA [Candidatus Omnitrophica bacterium]|nr:molybdopterin molybdotransferase MoeA [Candidatus Omnitrophota bacterium]
MIKCEKALSIVINSIKGLGSEGVDVSSSLHRILAQDIYAQCDVPPFNNSAMDGYALKSTDVKGASYRFPAILKVIDDVRAGYVSKKRLKKKQAMRVMTGAPIPSGTDSVVMVEFTQRLKTGEGEFVKVFKTTEDEENIRLKGEDVKKGQGVLTKGSLIRPQEMGMLASMGINRLEVAKKLRIGILVTGDELVKMGQRLSRGKIRNSNTYSLTGQVLAVGATPVNLGIARDNKAAVRQKIINGINKNIDLFLVSGGVSMGDYDLVKDVLAELGSEIKIWRVAIRPGKPLVFGYIKGIPVFGLPGNPVSSMVVFEEFVRPAILKMSGAGTLFRPVATAIFAQSFKKTKGLKYFVRVRIENKNNKFYAYLTGPQGSGILKSLVLADAIMVVPEEISELKKGQRVCIQLLTDRF